jgi:hypothetical protein
MTDEIMRFAANFKTLDDPAKIHGICRMTLPPDHSDAVLLTDHSGRTNGIYMESDEALNVASTNL